MPVITILSNGRDIDNQHSAMFRAAVWLSNIQLTLCGDGASSDSAPDDGLEAADLQRAFDGAKDQPSIHKLKKTTVITTRNCPMIEQSELLARSRAAVGQINLNDLTLITLGDGVSADSPLSGYIPESQAHTQQRVESLPRNIGGCY